MGKLNRVSWRLLAIVIAGGGVTTAEAGILIEPYAGYHFGSFNVDSVDNLPSSDLSFNGAGLGLRLGAAGTVLFAAADVHYGLTEIEGSGGNDDFEANRLLLGAVLGVKLSSLRAWGGVNFINSFSSDFPDAATELDYEGIGYKVGLGFQGLPWLSLNIEYLFSPIGETCEGDRCSDIEGDSEISADSIFISLSLPLGS